MESLLAKGQKVVDNIVNQSSCISTNEKLRLNHYIWLTFLSFPLCLIFIVHNLVTAHWAIASIVTAFVLCTSISLVAVIKKYNLPFIYEVNNLFFLLMLILITNWGTQSEGQILWCYTYPLLSIFLFGNRIGIRWSLLLLFTLLCSLWLDSNNEFTIAPSFEARFAASYLTILLTTSWLEYYRNRYTEKFIVQKQELLQERETLKQEIARRTLLEKRLHRHANEDGLTELCNRRYFLTRAQQEVIRAQQHRIPVSMALIDLDNFKIINDQFGHPIGDKVLKCFAQKCAEHFPAPAICGRMGGEEFSVLLLNVSEAEAYQKMEAFRHEISDTVLHFDDVDIQLTISIGLSELKRKNSTVNLLYSASDNALYNAKRNGRNRVEIATT
jgi:diguanylate cyclase (GGDEF)-like protein